MNIRIYFPGGKRVNAEYDGFTIATDQPTANGGEGTAPAPFDLFLASIGTCAGYYVLSFCRQRGIPTTGLEIRQTVHYDQESHRVDRIDLALKLPPGFPDKYRTAVIRAADLCTVKRHLEHPPVIHVFTT
jgi:ribosomal protein S12 methylthiotransferase accessory factor